MSFYEWHALVDVLDSDPDGYFRAYNEDVFVPLEIGQVVFVHCDDAGIFARVVMFEPNGGPDWIAVLEEVKGEEAEHAAEDLALSFEVVRPTRRVRPASAQAARIRGLSMGSRSVKGHSTRMVPASEIR